MMQSAMSKRVRGFTLVEVISTIAVLGILGSIAAGLIFQISNGYLQATTTSQLHAEASAAMDRIVRELRNIQRDNVVQEPAPLIDLLTADSISFDGTSSLELVNGQLILTNEGVGHVLLADVTEFDLQPFDESNQLLGVPLAASQCDPIRRVRIRLALERHGTAHTLRTTVFIRSTGGAAGVGT